MITSHIVNPLLVSNNLIHISLCEDNSMTPMKLQRLLYIIYRDYIIKTGQPLFSERFEAWKYGPALLSVYNNFYQYYDNPITQYIKPFQRVKEDTSFEFTHILHSVWNMYRNYNGIELSEVVRGVNSAWYKAWINYKIFLDDKDIINECRYECSICVVKDSVT